MAVFKGMRKLIALLLVALFASALGAQTTLSTLVGRVTAGGAGLPGVTVSVNSPALQGQRAAVTGPDGQYVVPALPPGDYLVHFTLSGMQQAVQRAQLRLAETTRVDAEMRQQALSEEIVVRPAEQTVLETPQVSMNMDASTIEFLPTTRGILDYAKLTPGVVEVGSRNLLSISGAQPYDNLYMVNGVTITDRRDNQPLNLYIEDAIQEATVLTAGVSAEYGRFIGGVVNVITKSGGNTLSGSLRDTVSSNDWTSKTPYAAELDHLTDIDHELQATLGGGVVRDRLWFFLAGRNVAKNFGRQTRVTNIGFTNETAEHRYEGKLTTNITSNHSFVGSYLNVLNTRDNIDSGSVDLRGLYDIRSTTSLGALRYSGILRESFVVEGQFSMKRRSTETPPVSPDVDRSFLNGSTIWDQGPNGSMWAPVICAVCGNDEGHGNDVILKVSRFTPTHRFGTHDLVAGVDEYHDLGRSTPFTSSSGFYIYGHIEADGQEAFPIFSPDEAYIDYYDTPPTSQSDFRTRSVFVNDQITLGSRLTTTVGLRYDQNHAEDIDGRVVVNDARLSPRIGVTYDLRGDGRDRFSASFGRYSSKGLENPLEPATSSAGQTIYTWYYDGPEISGVPAAEAMRQLYEWFQDRGGLEDRSDAEVFANLAYNIGDRLTSPATDEYTLGYGHQFGSAGLVQINYINRHSFDYYTVHLTTANRDALGDHIIVDNDSGDAERKYQAIQLQTRWRRRRFNVAANYTWSKLRGNVEQESNGFPVAEISGEDWYPEYSGYEQFKPIGWLANDMRHVASAWAGYDLSTERTHINVSVLQRFHTGRNYNARGNIQVRNVIPNPGYATVPVGLQYYFEPRGGRRLPDVTSTGLALNASRKIGPVQLFGQIDVTNVFNEDEIENPGGIDTRILTVSADRNLAAFNPVTTAPIECPAGVASSSAQCRGIAHYRYSPTFGQPLAASAYQTPRTYGFSLGARF
jgi:hypothetical protein